MSDSECEDPCDANKIATFEYMMGFWTGEQGETNVQKIEKFSRLQQCF